LLIPAGCGLVFSYLFWKHEELETVSIGLCGVRGREDEMVILLTIFSNLNLRSITIRNIKSSEDYWSSPQRSSQPREAGTEWLKVVIISRNY